MIVAHAVAVRNLESAVAYEISASDNRRAGLSLAVGLGA